MQDLTFYLFIGIFILGAIMIVLSNRRAAARRQLELQQRAAGRQQLLARRGWQHEADEQRSKRVYRYCGASEDIAWQLESSYQRSGQNGARMSTRWWTESVRLPGQALLLFPLAKDKSADQVRAAMRSLDPRADLRSSSLVARMLFQSYLTFTFGVKLTEAFESLHQFVLAGDQLRAHYAILASDDSVAGRLLSRQVEAQLIAAAGTRPASGGKGTLGPGVLLDGKGLMLAFWEAFEEPAEVEAAVDLGAALATACRSAAAF